MIIYVAFNLSAYMKYIIEWNRICGWLWVTKGIECGGNDSSYPEISWHFCTSRSAVLKSVGVFREVDTCVVVNTSMRIFLVSFCDINYVSKCHDWICKHVCVLKKWLLKVAKKLEANFSYKLYYKRKWMKSFVLMCPQTEAGVCFAKS